MIKIEDAEIGMKVMTKNHGVGRIVDFYVSDLPQVYAIVETENGTHDYPLAWLSRLGERKQDFGGLIVKENELRKHANCSVCGNPIGHSGLPLFWTAKIKRHGILMKAVRRQDGLAAFFGGNSGLAQVMGPDEEMTEILMDVELTLCENCAMKNDLIISALNANET